MSSPPAAELPRPGDPEVLYLLDVSGYVFRAYHAVPPLSTSRGEPTHAVHGFTNMLLKLVDDQKPSKVAAALDPPGPSFRKEVYAEYKANRPAAPEDLHQQMNRCLEIIEAYEIPRLVSSGNEADDVIATVVRRARSEGLRVVIVASDKDLLQLVEPGVLVYDTMRSRVYGPLETEAKLGVPPSKVRDYLALTGDSSDNVPGVPSVGPKTAVRLLNDYGDLDGIYEKVEEIPQAGLRGKLIQYRDNAFLSRDLVTLRSDVELELDIAAWRWSGGVRDRLRDLFVDLEFHRLLSKLEPQRRPQAARRFEIARTPADLQALVDGVRGADHVAIYTAIDNQDPLEGTLVGLGIAWSDEAATYVPMAHRYLGVPEQLSPERVFETLGPVLEDARFPKRSSDLKRDEMVLRRHGVTLRGGQFDTTIASYLLDAGKHAHDLDEVARSELELDLVHYDRVTDKQRGKQKSLDAVEIDQGRDYAAARAAAVWAVVPRLQQRIQRDGFEDLMRDVELPLAHVLADMEAVGVRVDVDLLKAMAEQTRQRLAELERRCFELAGREFNVGSARQLETVLFDELGLPVVKRTKTARSTDHEVLEELAPLHGLPEAILEYRMLSKLKSTYLDALPRVARGEEARIHTVYNQAVAATGRLSSSDPNLQNIPIRTEIGRRIRDAFVPRDGWAFLSADYSQIELRVLAHLSGDSELIEAFQKEEDVHVRTATALFDVGPEAVTREQRGQAKTVNYAVIYGQSHFALARNLRIERSQAKQYIDAFFARYAGVKAYMDGLIEEARRTGSVRTLLGRRRMLADLNSRNRSLRQGAERVARNTPIQGSAADIIKVAMVRIHRDLVSKNFQSKMLLTVHDELVFEAPPAEKKKLEKLVRTQMENAVPLSVPLVVDQGWGKTWGEAH